MGVTINQTISYKQHALKKQAGNYIPTYFLFIDTETKPYL
ncbi:unnamed protein product, partial [marine sediment metagenome]